MKLDSANRSRLLPIAALMAGLWAFHPSSAFDANALTKQQASAERVKSDASVYSEIAQAPEKERARRNPFGNDGVAIAAGGKLFAEHCAECHGDAAEGGRKAPSLRAKEVENAPPGALFWLLTNGVVRRGMPVWSKLPEPQRWQIVAFLKSLRDD